jgi:hypothetical protein
MLTRCAQVPSHAAVLAVLHAAQVKVMRGRGRCQRKWWTQMRRRRWMETITTR